MDQLSPWNKLLIALDSVTKDTFRDLSDDSTAVRFYAARAIRDAAKSPMPAAVASVHAYMDAAALSKAANDDPDWKVRRAAKAATLAVADRYAHFFGIDEHAANEKPGYVCEVLQATNEQLIGFAQQTIDDLTAGNPRPSSKMPPSFRN